MIMLHIPSLAQAAGIGRLCLHIHDPCCVLSLQKVMMLSNLYKVLVWYGPTVHLRLGYNSCDPVISNQIAIMRICGCRPSEKLGKDFSESESKG